VNATLDVLAVMDDAQCDLEQAWGTNHASALGMAEARAAVAEVFEACGPLLESLAARINADNAMTPQAVMVRRAAQAIVRAGGAK